MQENCAMRFLLRNWIRAEKMYKKILIHFDASIKSIMGLVGGTGHGGIGTDCTGVSAAGGDVRLRSSD